MISFSYPQDAHDYEGKHFPLLVENHLGMEQMPDVVKWITKHRDAIDNALNVSGAVLLRNFPVNSAEDFDSLIGAMNYPPFTYQESLSNAVRINYTERVFTANEAPPNVEIFLHHEMAQTPLSPDHIFFYCNSAAEKGGATPVCRSDMLYAKLKVEAPELAQQFKEHGVKYTSRMPEEDDAQHGQGRSWSSTLSVESREAAEEKLRSLGYSWSWLEGGGLQVTTPVLPAVKKLDDGSESFYNQLVAAYLGWEGVKDDPSQFLCFGDDSPIPLKGLEKIADLADEFSYDLSWQDNDVVLVDNRRVMHGRKPFSGDRKRLVLVALGK